MSEPILPGMRVRWRDGDSERIGWVAMRFNTGEVYVQDEAMYTYRVHVDDLTLAPYTQAERDAIDELVGQ